MDVNKALRELHEEKRRLDETIAVLEARLKTASGAGKPRRGRKRMSAEERREVSRRMMKYWEARKASAQSLQPQSSAISAAAGVSVSA